MQIPCYTVKFIGRSRDLPSPPGTRRGHKGCEPFIVNIDATATPAQIRRVIRKKYRVWGQISISPNFRDDN